VRAVIEGQFLSRRMYAEYLGYNLGELNITEIMNRECILLVA